jgi:hypothetical protein
MLFFICLQEGLGLHIGLETSEFRHQKTLFLNLQWGAYTQLIDPGEGTRGNLLNHVRKNVGYFLFICEKIYTIL